MKCEYIIRSTGARVITCDKPATWKSEGKYRAYYCCDAHRNEFVEQAPDKDVEKARWDQIEP